MATPTHSNHPDPDQPGEAAVVHIYRAGVQQEPSAALDHTILAAAREAVQNASPRAALGAGWVIPVSMAAVVLISFGVLLRLQGPALSPPVASPPPTASREESPATRTQSAAEPAPAKRVPATASPARATGQIADGMTSPSDTEALRTDPSPARSAALATSPEPKARSAEPPKSAVLNEMAPSLQRFKKEANSMPIHADVTAVSTSGQPGAYHFNVALRSPDTGCQQYANWWEVVSEDGKLLYRRILQHSHVNEQPFTRRGGPVPLQPATRVWVRAHMNTGGYGGGVLHGSVQSGFAPDHPRADFALDLATQAPQPTGCDF